ncbi:MAG: PQQ-binding-like beta-propeller repeat protein [Alphaproteobacteria bacterium]|nr:PQQ-binding-like beta-propeller repeat protein [Alphaproteobacteria bacterium]
MKFVRPVVLAAAAASLSACATVGRLNPFGGEDAPTQTAPQDGRVSILTFEQALTPDPQLQAQTIVVPAPAPNTEWAQPGGNAQNAPVNLMGELALDVDYSRSVGEGSSRRERLAAPPVIAGGKIYLIDAGHVVHALDLQSGREAWSERMRPDEGRDRRALGGGVAAGDGRIYVTTGYGFTAALDAQTGAELWRARANAPFHAAPTFANGRVFAVTNDSELIAMDAATGEVQWTHQAIAEPARILSASSPAVAGDTVIAPFASGEVIALLTSNGRRLWVDALSRAGRLTSLSAINDIAGRPVVDAGVVYAASHSGLLAAIDLRSGQRIWSRPFASTQTPWIAGEVLYAVSSDSELAAFNRETGNVYWVRQLTRFQDEEDRKGRVAWTGPVMVGGRLVLANSLGDVVAVSPLNGEIVGQSDVRDAVFIPPVAADGRVFFLTDEAKLVAMR